MLKLFSAQIGEYFLVLLSGEGCAPAVEKPVADLKGGKALVLS